MLTYSYVYFTPKAHPTLTYLDLRSNSISNLGLSSLTAPLSNNQVLYHLDLRGNKFSQEALLFMTSGLQDAGSQLYVRWEHSIASSIRSAPSTLGHGILDAPHKVQLCLTLMN